MLVLQYRNYYVFPVSMRLREETFQKSSPSVRSESGYGIYLSGSKSAGSGSGSVRRQRVALCQDHSKCAPPMATRRRTAQRSQRCWRWSAARRKVKVWAVARQGNRGGGRSNISRPRPFPNLPSKVSFIFGASNVIYLTGHWMRRRKIQLLKADSEA